MAHSHPAAHLSSHPYANTDTTSDADPYANTDTTSDADPYANTDTDVDAGQFPGQGRK
jgi:hypothetical protein